MNEYLKLLFTLTCLWLSVNSSLAAQVEQFEYDDFIISDCPSAAPTLSISAPQTLAALAQQSQTFIDTINQSVVVAALPYLSIDEKPQSYRKISLNEKSINLSQHKTAAEVFIYGWENASFEWFNSYSSNQSKLSPRPFFALARYQQQTLALASATVTGQQSLLTLLEDDFIQQRTPIVVFIRLSSTLSSTSKQRLDAANLEYRQLGDVVIASRGLAICDSGSLNKENKLSLVWMKIAPN